MKKEEIILDCGCRYRYKNSYSSQLAPVLYSFTPCGHHLEKYRDDFIEIIGKVYEDCHSFHKIELGED